ncbi:putative plastid-lipid-associated protein 3, chloroplastic [Iris pallida]|uniref:Plastid-lipid-associated protein 3, chloroplastic n=1 Tax=Iris pallida TaxID=29817 RepID=A0AAX6FR75_IRIPA|nr:putative plastid-lipid-associated protein 3, chloroplastic [Iris pallida]
MASIFFFSPFPHSPSPRKPVLRRNPKSNTRLQRSIVPRANSDPGRDQDPTPGLPRIPNPFESIFTHQNQNPNPSPDPKPLVSTFSRRNPKSKPTPKPGATVPLPRKPSPEGSATSFTRHDHHPTEDAAPPPEQGAVSESDTPPEGSGAGTRDAKLRLDQPLEWMRLPERQPITPPERRPRPKPTTRSGWRPLPILEPNIPPVSPTDITPPGRLPIPILGPVIPPVPPTEAVYPAAPPTEDDLIPPTEGASPPTPPTEDELILPIEGACPPAPPTQDESFSPTKETSPAALPSENDSVPPKEDASPAAPPTEDKSVPLMEAVTPTAPPFEEDPVPPTEENSPVASPSEEHSVSPTEDASPAASPIEDEFLVVPSIEDESVPPMEAAPPAASPSEEDSVSPMEVVVPTTSSTGDESIPSMEAASPLVPPTEDEPAPSTEAASSAAPPSEEDSVLPPTEAASRPKQAAVSEFDTHPEDEEELELAPPIQGGLRVETREASVSTDELPKPITPPRRMPIVILEPIVPTIPPTEPAAPPTEDELIRPTEAASPAASPTEDELGPSTEVDSPATSSSEEVSVPPMESASPLAQPTDDKSIPPTEGVSPAAPPTEDELIPATEAAFPVSPLTEEDLVFPTEAPPTEATSPPALALVADEDGSGEGGDNLLPVNGNPVLPDSGVGDLKRKLVCMVSGTDYGFTVSADVRGKISELVSLLEVKNMTLAPTEKLDGNWILLYTAFSELLPLVAVGTIPLVKVKQISQVIDSKSMTVVNAATISNPFASFSFSATASYEVLSSSRVQVRLKDGEFPHPQVFSTVDLPADVEIFGLKISLVPVQQKLNPLQAVFANITRSISGLLPHLKVPIPGSTWLLTTYVDEDFRISRGDGGLFVLAKEGSPLLDDFS